MKSRIPIVLAVVAALACAYLLGRRASANGEGPIAAVFGDGGAASRKALAAAEARIRELEAEMARLKEAHDRRKADLDGALRDKTKLDADIAAMKIEVEKMNKEWTFSYGTTRDAGKFLGSMLRDGVTMRNMDPNDPEAATKARDMFLKFASMGPILQEMQKIDDKPKEFAEFRASILGEALGLSEAERTKVAAVVERYKTQANTLPVDSAERQAINERAVAEVTASFTDEQKSLLGEISNSGMGGGQDLLETPSLDPGAWRQRMQRNRPAQPAPKP